MAALPASKRVKKPAIEVAQSRDETAELIKQLGDAQRQMTRELADMNDKLAVITKAHQPKLAELTAQIESLQVRIQGWCEPNRAALTHDGEVKSANLVTGEIGWRADPPSVNVRNAEEVLLRLDELALAEAWTRSKREINKEAILADRTLSLNAKDESEEKAAAMARLAKLAEVGGLSINAGREKFFITPFEQVAP